MAKIEEKVEKLVKEPIEKNGYTLYDVEYAKEGKEYYLRIFIEKPNQTISIEDCEKVNDIVNPILDETEVIKDQYYLEVSSTGVEKNLRKLEHYKDVIGKEIKIKLFKKDDEGNKEIEGLLEKVDEHEITLQKDGKNIIVTMSNIAQAKTLYHW